MGMLRSLNSWLYFCRQGERITRGLTKPVVSPRVVSAGFTHDYMPCEFCTSTGRNYVLHTYTTLFGKRQKYVPVQCPLCKGLGFVIVKHKRYK